MSKFSRTITGLGAITVAGLISEWAWRQIFQRRPHELFDPDDEDGTFLFLTDDIDDRGVLDLTNRLRKRRGEPTVLVVHTFGGDLSDVARLARAVEVHGRVQVWVPYRAFSGGTLVGLAANNIVLWPDACLGPVDPQLCVGWSGFSSHSLDHVVDKKKDVDEFWLATSREARRAFEDVKALLGRFRVPESAMDRLLNAGNTHGFPIFLDEAIELGLPVEPPPQNLEALDSTRLSRVLQSRESKLR